MSQFNKHILYQHRRLDTNEIFYVGIGKTIKRAYYKHNRNRHWHNIVNKVGYKVEILSENLTWDDACEQERTLIAFIGRFDLKLGSLTNQTNGGDGSTNPSVETRQKRSQSLHGNQNGRGNKGKTSPMRDKNHTEETKQKMREKKLGSTSSDETKKKLSLSSPSKKVCCVDGNIYHSAAEAARQLNLTKSQLHHRLHSKDFNNYSYT
jgi:hypothetical protein